MYCVLLSELTYCHDLNNFLTVVSVGDSFLNTLSMYILWLYDINT